MSTTQEFPPCAACGSKKNPTKGGQPVKLEQKATMLDGTKAWYCNRPQCQRAKQFAQQSYPCEICKIHKPREAYEIYKSRNLKKVCATCEFPSCAACGTKHSGTKALYTNAPGRLLGQWFCKKPACQDAFRQAQAEAKKHR